MSFSNMTLRILTLALALLLAIGLTVSCGRNTPAETTVPTDTATVVTTTQTEPPIEYFKLTDQAVLVRPEGDVSEDMMTAIKLFTGAGNSLVEGGIKVTEDWYRSA